jgi:N-acetylneuraminic acid mutarotase
MGRRRQVLAFALGIALAGCGGGPPGPSEGSISGSAEPSKAVEALPSAVSSPAASSLPAIGGTWTTGVPLPSRRAENAAVAIDGVIYVAGGMVDHGETTDVFDAFDTRTGTWRSLPPLPEKRDHMGLAALDGQIYLTGGSIFYQTAIRSGLWRFDPTTERWTALAPMPAARAQHASVALGGRIYVVGGVAGAPRRARELWAYDVAGGRWITDLAPLPTEREHLTAVAAGGRLIAIGGRKGGQIGAVEAYDPATDAWTSLPDLPTPRGGSATGLIDRVIHVAGGEDLNNNSTFPQHEALDLTTMTWSRGPDLPTKRHGIASAVVDGRWYVIDGGRSAGTSISDLVEIYTP